MSLILTPTRVSEITQAVVECLRADARLSAANIGRSEEINETPSSCPWIGVYRAGIRYPSRVLGLGAGYRDQRIDLVILMQESHGSGGEQCEDALEDLVQIVLSVLLTDPTLGGKVQTLDGIDVRYPSYERTAANEFMQTAALYITAIGGIQ